MREFRGGVAVVTGAASGIGLGLVRQCLAEGMKVVLADLWPAPLQELAAELAGAVVAHLEALCRDPELRDPDQFCAYRRLARHWRWLSAQHRDAPGVTSDLGRLAG